MGKISVFFSGSDPVVSLCWTGPCPVVSLRLTTCNGCDVAGQRIDDARLKELIEGTDLLIAHNASFDRPFFDRRFPELRGLAWACSREVPWRDAGFEGTSLQHIAMMLGFFYDGHRAVSDCRAGVHALSCELPRDGLTCMAHLADSARRATVRIWANGSPFETKDALKARGYRWDNTRRVWWVEVAEDEIQAEYAWLFENVYGRSVALPTERKTAKDRFVET